MTDELFIKIVGAIITIFVALITSVVIPYIKTKITTDQIATFDYYLDLAVRCANQIYPPEEWQKKKEYVTTYIKDVVNDKLSLTLTDQDIDTLIEGMVNQLKVNANDK